MISMSKNLIYEKYLDSPSSFFPFLVKKKKKKELQERRPPQASVHLSSFLLHPLKLKSFAPFRWSNYNFISGQPTRLDIPTLLSSLAADRDAPFLPRPFNVFISSPWSRIRKEKLGKNSTHPFLHAVVSWLLWFMEEVAFVADYFFFFFPPGFFYTLFPLKPRSLELFEFSSIEIRYDQNLRILISEILHFLKY